MKIKRKINWLLNPQKVNLKQYLRLIILSFSSWTGNSSPCSAASCPKRAKRKLKTLIQKSSWLSCSIHLNEKKFNYKCLDCKMRLLGHTVTDFVEKEDPVNWHVFWSLSQRREKCDDSNCGNFKMRRHEAFFCRSELKGQMMSPAAGEQPCGWLKILMRKVIMRRGCKFWP